MLERDELKVAVEDARARQAALVQLIYFTDTQAMNLLRTYITIGAAMVSVIGLAAGGQWNFKDVLIGTAMGVLLSTLVGAYYCFVTLGALKEVEINLPGRGPEFWEWGLAKDVSHDDVALAYMRQLGQSMASNRQTNASSVRDFKLAQIFGLISPFIGLGGGLVAAFLRWI